MQLTQRIVKEKEISPQCDLYVYPSPTLRITKKVTFIHYKYRVK